MSEAIRGGEIYYGLALVMDKWHTTACEPINLNDTLVGMLYVGNKENDMGELKRILSDLKLAKADILLFSTMTGICLSILI